MKLSDYIKKKEILTDCEFETTYCPFFVQKKSIGYAVSKNALEKLNSDKNVVGIIVPKKFQNHVSKKIVLLSDNPQKTFYELHNKIVEKKGFNHLNESYISKSAKIANSSIISDNVYIGENVNIGNGAIINENCYIGDGTIIEDYAIIGAKGMQETKVEGINFKINYAGGVRIGQNCQILAQAIIQKPYQPFNTEIGDNSQISVKVVVGHGSQIGTNTMIAGSCQIAGNVRIGNNVFVGPSATFSDAIKIGDNATIKLGSVVVSDVKNNDIISGNFALSHKKHIRQYTKIKKERR